MSHAVNPNNNVTASIDGITVTVPEGTTILAAAQKAGIKIPTLCHHPDLNLRATCRVCVVEVKGQRRLQTACNNPISDGDVILTTTKQVRETRKTILELILANHPQECLTCVRNESCELQQLARDYNLTESPFGTIINRLPIEDSNPCIVRDMGKCIKCTRCVEACQEVQQVYAISTSHRSGKYGITTAFEKSLADSTCVYCGQCINVCPVGALSERDDTAKVWSALENPNLHVVVQVAPAVQVALRDEFCLPNGTDVTGKMVAALRRLGFDKVFDTDSAADLTIIEEGSELVHRIQEGGKLPLLTSGSPGWSKVIEIYHPDLVPHLSTCKSQQQAFGALFKAYYAEETGLAPENIYVVAIVPSIAKKAEIARPEMKGSGVDVVLTMRELAGMIKMTGLNFAGLADDEFDLRPRNQDEHDLGNVDFNMVPGPDGVKETEIKIEGLKVKIAVTNDLKSARLLLDKIKRGEAEYQAIEVMSCPVKSHMNCPGN